MNQDNNSIIINFINNNKSAIVFWIVMLLTLPFIIFFMVFNISDLTTVNNIGLFGSYLSGMAGFITIIMTSISVIILYYTLRITIENNNSQIKYSSEQHTISNINLLIDLYNENSIKYSSTISNYTQGILSPKPDFNFNKIYRKEIDKIINHYGTCNYDEKITETYQPKLAEFLIKNKSHINNTLFKNNSIEGINFTLDLIDNTKLSPFLTNPLSMTSATITEISRIIKNNNNSPDFKKILILVVNSKIDNDSIFWSIAYSDTTKADKAYNINMLCKIPRELSSYVELFSIYF